MTFCPSTNDETEKRGKVEREAKNIFLKMAQQSATLCLTGQNWQAYNHGRAVHLQIRYSGSPEPTQKSKRGL